MASRELSAQTISRDTTFGVGACRTTAAPEPAIWARVIADADSAPRLLPGTVPGAPMFLRDRSGNYRGRVLLSFVVDSTGWVVPGTISVDESTDARLSEWACKVAVVLRYRPAHKGGVAVYVLKDQALSYVFGNSPM
jgi:hypothetical protein